MIFNEHWTKSDNDKLRQMVKEGKTFEEKLAFFGWDKMQHHPNKKFSHVGSILTYEKYLNEIKINPHHVYYTIDYVKSQLNDKYYDYYLSFDVNDIKYLIILHYCFSNDIGSYNIFFTTEENYINYNKYVKKIDNSGIKILTREQQIEIENIAERQTNLNDIIPIMKSISYILFRFYPTIKDVGNLPYSLIDTNDPRKIKIYRNIITDSFDNVSEEIIKNEDGSNIYYYYIKNN
jgi:hypothetical protein